MEEKKGGTVAAYDYEIEAATIDMTNTVLQLHWREDHGCLAATL